MHCAECGRISIEGVWAFCPECAGYAGSPPDEERWPRSELSVLDVGEDPDDPIANHGAWDRASPLESWGEWAS